MFNVRHITSALTGLALLVSLLSSCEKEPARTLPVGPFVLSLDVSCEKALQTRSSIISNPSVVKDLNIWVYSADGDLIETHYIGNLSFSGSKTFTLQSNCGSNSSVILIANAGYAIVAPSTASAEVSITPVYSGSDNGVFAVGKTNGLYFDGSKTFSGNITLDIAMARADISFSLSPEAEESGYELCSNDDDGSVKIKSLRICNATKTLSWAPSSSVNSMRNYAARSASELDSYELAGADDLAAFNAGSAASLYTLPNYCQVPNRTTPNGTTGTATYFEAVAEFSGNEAEHLSQGDQVYRFYAMDSASQIGLRAPYVYTYDVMISNGVYDVTDGLCWRKDMFNFVTGTNSVIVDETNLVRLFQPKSAAIAGNYTFALSATDDRQSDGTFVISKAYGSSNELVGVNVSAEAPGEATLYVRDPYGHSGSIPLKAAYRTTVVIGGIGDGGGGNSGF